jgi:hypothetical protein
MQVASDKFFSNHTDPCLHAESALRAIVGRRAKPKHLVQAGAERTESDQFGEMALCQTFFASKDASAISLQALEKYRGFGWPSSLSLFNADGFLYFLFPMLLNVVQHRHELTADCFAQLYAAIDIFDDHSLSTSPRLSEPYVSQRDQSIREALTRNEKIAILRFFDCLEVICANDRGFRSTATAWRSWCDSAGVS